MRKKDYSNYSKDELIEEIKKLKKRKKYGLVWDKKLENVVQLCKQKLPILQEDKKREIITNKEKPFNILIEGDNYHILSVLNYTHNDAIDVIYIDPPYNTGNKDFIFNDNYVDKDDPWRHSKWLSFIKKRFCLLKDILKRSGIIIISIDDNELAQLKLFCDEVFGVNNFIAILPTIMNLKGNQDQFGFAGTHEYTLIYCKNKKYAKFKNFYINEEELLKWEEDDYGFFKEGANLKATGKNAPREKRENLFFPIFIKPDNNIYIADNDKKNNKDDARLLPITSGKEMSWRWSKEKIMRERHNIIVKRRSNNITLYKKQRPSLGDLPSKKPKTLFYKPEYSSGNGTNLLKEMFGKKVFDNPKPLELIKDLLILTTKEDSIILDFTAGSGTTGHAILELNKDDNNNRKFILCTNNENKICTEVCYPRLKMAIEGYQNSKGIHINGLKSNLKYFKTDFVDSESTDSNKKKLTEKATEMLCIKEGTFKQILNDEKIKIFKNGNQYTGIIFDQLEIPRFKNTIKKIEGKFNVYIFSLGGDIFEEEFTDISNKVKLSPIPEAILKVYRRIFK